MVLSEHNLLSVAAAIAVSRWALAMAGTGPLGTPDDQIRHPAGKRHRVHYAYNASPRRQPGERLEVRVGPGHKEPHVTEVPSVDSSTAAPATRRSSPPRTASNSPIDVSAEQSGTVKWFNPEKGYGFIALADRGQDVFVHISALERYGFTGLAEGQQVVVDVGEGRKGPEAVKVRLL